MAETLIAYKIINSNSLWFEKMRNISTKVINFTNKFLFFEGYRIRLFMDQPNDTGVDCDMELVGENSLPDFSITVSETAVDQLSITKFCSHFAKNFKTDTAIDLQLQLQNTSELTFIHSHFTGGCSIGDSQENSIVDSNCESHIIKNIFIAGPSVFPTHSFCNPFLTISAISLRLGKYINEKFK